MSLRSSRLLLAASLLILSHPGFLHRTALAQGPARGAQVGGSGQVNPVLAGEFIVDPPTLINLGFEWMIEGDDNRNASVAVTYRKKGETQWHQALPLLRLQNERIYQGDRLDL